jgi:hypothetical protein
VAATFPNDYRAIQRAIKGTSFIDIRSRLGEAYLAFSKMLIGEEQEPEKRSFMGLLRK